MNKRIFRKKNGKRKRPVFPNFRKILLWADICDLLNNKYYLNAGKSKIEPKK